MVQVELEAREGGLERVDAQVYRRGGATVGAGALDRHGVAAALLAGRELEQRRVTQTLGRRDDAEQVAGPRRDWRRDGSGLFLQVAEQAELPANLGLVAPAGAIDA